MQDFAGPSTVSLLFVPGTHGSWRISGHVARHAMTLLRELRWDIPRRQRNVIAYNAAITACLGKWTAGTKRVNLDRVDYCNIWLVVWNIFFFFHLFPYIGNFNGISFSQLTNSYFSEGLVYHKPDMFVVMNIIKYIYTITIL